MTADVIDLPRREGQPDRIAVDQILIGERRRKSLGDLSDLIASIRRLGVLSPIALSPDRVLVAGERRVEAARAAGLAEIPYVIAENVTDALSALWAERDENTCRKPMTITELRDLARQIEALERPASKQRQREGQERGRAVQSGFPSGDGKPLIRGKTAHAGETATQVGQALGMSAATYNRMLLVYRAADGKNGDGDLVRAVAAHCITEMDEGRLKINGAAERVRSARRNPKSFNADGTMRGPKPAPASAGRNRRTHHQMIEAIVGGVIGSAGVADMITDLDDSISPDQAARWQGDLVVAVRSLNRIRKLLKERTQ